MAIEGEDQWRRLRELTGRIVREDPTLTEIRLLVPPPRPPPPSSTHYVRPGREPDPDRTSMAAALIHLEGAIRNHAPHCRGVTSIAMCRGFFPDAEQESQVLSRLHSFPGLRDIRLESPHDAGGSHFACLSLDFISRRICWPRTRRVEILTTLDGGGGRRGGVGARPLPPEEAARTTIAGRLRGALQLEEFAAPRLEVTQPLRWHRQTRLVEALAELPRLRTLHLGHVGHAAGATLLGPDAMRVLARSSSLETLKLVRFGIDDDSVEAFCQELVLSNSATRLRCVDFDDFVPLITRAGCTSFWNLLSVNATITSLHLHCFEEEGPMLGQNGPPLATLEEDIQAMCRINRVEPQALQAGPPCASNDDWLRLLEAAGDSLGATYWLLQKYPALVSSASRFASSKPPASRLLGKHELRQSIRNAKRARTH